MEAQIQTTDHSFQSKTVRMLDGDGPPDGGLDQSRRQKRTYNMSSSRTRRGSGGLWLYQLETREILRKVKRIDEVTPNMVLNKALLDLYHKDLFSFIFFGGGHLFDQGRTQDEGEIPCT